MFFFWSCLFQRISFVHILLVVIYLFVKEKEEGDGDNAKKTKNSKAEKSKETATSNEKTKKKKNKTKTEEKSEKSEAAPSKKELEEKIKEILSTADRATITAKAIRSQLEKHFGKDLTSSKKTIDKIISKVFEADQK